MCETVRGGREREREDGSGKCPMGLAIVVFPQIEIDAATIVWSPVLVGANPDCHREVSASPFAFFEK